MTTNREIYMERLANMTTEELAAQLHDNIGHCRRCSNYYWDANVSYCHCNINKSSCVKGQAEWLESRPDENLQLKYNKRYYVFPDYDTMLLGLRLTRILEEEKLIDYSYEHQCQVCRQRQTCVKYNGPEQLAICQNVWISLNTMSSKYGRNLINKLPERQREGWDALQIDKKYIGTGARCWNYLRDVLIPSIKDDTHRAEATELIASIDKAIDNWGRKEY